MTTDRVPLDLILCNAARIVELERTNAALTKALLKMQKERDGLVVQNLNLVVDVR